MKARNKRIYSTDHDWLVQLKEEYENYGAWDTSLDGDCLTIFALHRKYQNRKSRKQRKKEKNSKHRTPAHKHNN